MVSFDWNAGKPVGGPESFSANPWRFDADSTFVTERDGCNGTWAVRLEENGALGKVVLRMDWRAGQAGNYAEFVLETRRRGRRRQRSRRARVRHAALMRSWAIAQRGNESGRGAAPGRPPRPRRARRGLLKLESVESVEGDDDDLKPAIDGMGRLQLVPAGSALALKLDHASALREGREAPLTAAGQHVGLFWESPRNAWGHWDYIDLGVSDEVRPLTVKLEGPYLVWRGPHGEMVFDVSMWRLEAGNHLVAVKACPGNPGGPTRMSKDAAGRDFVLNGDGTVSPRNARHLCLGHAGAPVLNALVLARGDSKNKCIFDKGALRSGKPTPLTLVSHPGLAIAKRYSDERRAGEWRYIESGVAKAPHAIRAVLTRDGFIELPGEDLVFDIAFWKFDEENTVNFVGGSSAGRTKIQDGPAGRSWVLNEDGSISPRSRSDLFLGVADKEVTGIRRWRNPRTAARRARISRGGGGGVWEEYTNIDMCGQGDVEIIGNWTASHSIDDLKRMVETKGYSAFGLAWPAILTGTRHSRSSISRSPDTASRPATRAQSTSTIAAADPRRRRRRVQDSSWQGEPGLI